MKLLKSILAGLVLGTATLPTLITPAAASSTFIKEQGNPKIYKIQGSKYCHVVNMEHLDILGGNNFGEVSSNEFRNITRNANYVGKCGLPAGFYKGRGEAAIYMLKGSNYCWVTDMNQYGRLKSRYGFSDFREVSDINSVTNLYSGNGACQS